MCDHLLVKSLQSGFGSRRMSIMSTLRVSQSGDEE